MLKTRINHVGKTISKHISLKHESEPYFLVTPQTHSFPICHTDAFSIQVQIYIHSLSHTKRIETMEWHRIFHKRNPRIVHIGGC